MRKRVITVLIVLLLMALALYYVPWPRSVEFRSTCVEVDRQGNVLSAEGEIVLEGTYYHYLFQRDTFQLTHLELPSVEVISTIEYSNGPPSILNAPKGYDFIWFVHGVEVVSNANSPRNTDVHYMTFLTHSDFPYFVFEHYDHEDHKYFATTNEGAPDPVRMLKEFCLYQETSEN